MSSKTAQALKQTTTNWCTSQLFQWTVHKFVKLALITDAPE